MNFDLFSVPTQAFGWLGPWVLVAQVVVYWMRLRPKMKELQDNADGSLRKDLMNQLVQRDTRIAKLEEDAALERADCNRRIEALEQMAFGKGATSTLSNGANP
jgi:hypothetical protein